MTYDPLHNVAYIRFKAKSGQNVQSLKITDAVIIDIASDGEIYGIELLNANEQLQKTQDGLILTYTNQHTDEKSEMKLAS